MALPLNVNELISGRMVEWERIEFKEGWDPEDIIHTICAYANDINNWGGGYIILGIREEGGKPILPPKGLTPETIDRIHKELLNLCNKLKPHFFPIAEPILFQGKHILIIWVFGGQNRPYRAPVRLGKKSHYAYYIRRFSSTVKAQFEDEKELMSLAGTIPFDDRICHLAEPADLKLPLIQSFLKEVESDLYKFAAEMPFEQLCWQIRIVDGTYEYLKPRNVGILFFNDMPQKFIPLSQIEIVQFPATVGEDRLNEKIFQGPIDQQIRDVLTYIKNVILKEYVRKLPDRVESVRFFNYPYIALKESIVNAMYHRSYEIREPVEIRIHPDKIEILSFPGPDRSIKRSDIDKGVLVARRYRNRRIGEFLKELKLTEGRCTGIPKIIKAMKDNGSPVPVFKTDDERSYFIVVLNIHPNALEYAQEESVPSLSQVCPKSVPSETAAIVLGAAKDDIDLKSLMSKLNQTNKTRFRRQIIKPLIEAGLLELTIPDKPKSSKQRYRTAKRYIPEN